MPPSIGSGSAAGYGPSQLAAELGAYGKKQDAEVRDAQTRKDQATYLRGLLQARLDQAFSAAADGAQSSSTPLVSSK